MTSPTIAPPGVSAGREQRVLVFPSRIRPEGIDRRLFFLFSMSQVEDVARAETVRPVPFAPSHFAGIAQWRDRILPVVVLEQRLGWAGADLPDHGENRLVVVRTKGEEGYRRVMVRARSPLEMIPIPEPCRPAPPGGWLSDPRLIRLIRGIYEWEEGLLMVVHMERILEEKEG